MQVKEIDAKIGEEVGIQKRKGRDFSNLLKALSKEQGPPSPHSESPSHEKSLISIGTITRQRPTVSDLLAGHPKYGKKMWNIIHSEQNHTKPYTKIRPGTEIYLDPTTLELSWAPKAERSGDLKPINPSPPPHPPRERCLGEFEPNGLSEELVKAVKPCLGSPYAKLDCYELVVHGLEKIGVKYRGRGGLAEQLMKTALSKGLPRNAYFNGEGLIAASGSLVYGRSFSRIRNPDGEAGEVYRELKPLLEKGFILSFSTPTRGHTGIISRQTDSWTYINSGNMDHEVQPARTRKGVGEEFLMEELKNWFRLASERKESLQITLGHLNEENLRTVRI